MKNCYRYKMSKINNYTRLAQEHQPGIFPIRIKSHAYYWQQNRYNRIIDKAEILAYKNCENRPPPQ